VASLSQGRTAAAQCGLFTHKSVPVIFEPPCIYPATQQICIFFDTAGRTSNFAHHLLVLLLSPDWPDSADVCKTRIEL